MRKACKIIVLLLALAAIQVSSVSIAHSLYTHMLVKSVGFARGLGMVGVVVVATILRDGAKIAGRLLRFARLLSVLHLFF